MFCPLGRQTVVGIAAVTTAALLTLGVADPPDPPQPPASRDRGDATPASRAVRVGKGLVFGGGATMVIGAGVLLPISMHMLLKTPAPNPDDYTSVSAFRADVGVYKDTLDRATDLGVSGAIVGAVGAVTFVTGAIVWGAGSARNRRLARANAEHAPTISVLPTRRGIHAGLSLRF